MPHTEHTFALRDQHAREHLTNQGAFVLVKYSDAQDLWGVPVKECNQLVSNDPSVASPSLPHQLV